MTYALNAFELQFPDLEADLYKIDPQPSNDAYRILGKLERIFERELNGKAQKWHDSEDDTWYIAVLGAEKQQTINSREDSTSASFSRNHTLAPADYWDRMVLQRAISDSVKWYMTTYEDFWYHDDADALFYSSPRGKTGSFDTYTGFTQRVEFHETPQLVVKSLTKFIDERSLTDQIKNEGLQSASRKYGGQNFLLDRPEPTNCKLHGISEEQTVSDNSLRYRGEEISVLEFVKQVYGEKWANKIDPDEPLVQIRFGDSEPYDTAPSLLKASPKKLNRKLTSEATLSANERRKAIFNFINRIDYIQIEGEKVSINHDAIEPPTQGNYEYPDLQFGEEAILSVGTPNATSTSQEVHPGNWRWVTRDYLEEFGYWKAQSKMSEIVLVYPEGEQDRAESLYNDVRKKLSELGGIQIRSDPPRICYSDRAEFDEWVSEFGDSVDGVLGLIEGDGDEYFEIIDHFGGLPTQFVSVSTYSMHDGASEDVLFNTACGLAVKLGAYPFKPAEELSSDLYLGLSVAGDTSTTATAVAIDGRDGTILYQTEEPLSQGTSTVTGEYPAKRILQRSLKAASSAFKRPIESLVIHRNGRFGDMELDTFSTELPGLQEQSYVSSKVSWAAVEVIENHPYRIFADSGSHAPDTGAYTRLDDGTVLVTTFGEPQIHQGTPQPILCQRRAASHDYEAETIGKEIFELSFLNWGSPMMKMKSPVTTKIPKDLNEMFDKCSRVGYPPF